MPPHGTLTTAGGTSVALRGPSRNHTSEPPRHLRTVVWLSLLPTGLAAQWPPERLENLEVLPESIAVRELVSVMTGFTRALGVRCTYCHVGEEEQPLSAYDFPSDDKLPKRKAREMLRMVETINSRLLTTVPERRDPPVEVGCATCHHGIAVPRSLQAVLLLAYDAGGVDSAVSTYRSLRGEYHGTGAYDFSDVPLAEVGNALHRRGALADAVALHALNVEQNAGSTIARLRHARADLELAFSQQGPDAGATRYRELRAAYGERALPEFVLNELGYALLRAQHVPQRSASSNSPWRRSPGPQTPTTAWARGTRPPATSPARSRAMSRRWRSIRTARTRRNDSAHSAGVRDAPHQSPAVGPGVRVRERRPAYQPAHLANCSGRRDPPRDLCRGSSGQPPSYLKDTFTLAR